LKLDPKKRNPPPNKRGTLHGMREQKLKKPLQRLSRRGVSARRDTRGTFVEEIPARSRRSSKKEWEEGRGSRGPGGERFFRKTRILRGG